MGAIGGMQVGEGTGGSRRWGEGRERVSSDMGDGQAAGARVGRGDGGCAGVGVGWGVGGWGGGGVEVGGG